MAAGVVGIRADRGGWVRRILAEKREAVMPARLPTHIRQIIAAVRSAGETPRRIVVETPEGRIVIECGPAERPGEFDSVEWK